MNETKHAGMVGRHDRRVRRRRSDPGKFDPCRSGPCRSGPGPKRSGGERVASFLFAAELSGAFGAAQPVLAHGDAGDRAVHGGAVVPAGALHVEVVAKPHGCIDLYFSDNQGQPLPASAISRPSVEIEHPRGPTEYPAMTIGRSGEMWTGACRPLTDTGAIVHVGFAYRGQSLLADIPAREVIAAARDKGHHGH